MTTEISVACDHCGTDLTSDYPGEDYTLVTTETAVKRFHQRSTTERTDYHLCAEAVEPRKADESVYYRADSDRIPMMLLADRRQYRFVAREEFPGRQEEIARTLETAWAAGDA